MQARGLKLVLKILESLTQVVAPHAGAWIETRIVRPLRHERPRRAPCGRVD